jgi:hypothetical protein
MEIMMLSKISQTSKDKYHVFSLKRNLDLKKKLEESFDGRGKETRERGGKGESRRG